MLINRLWVTSPANRCGIWRAAFVVPILTATFSLTVPANRGTIAVAEPIRRFLPAQASRQEMLVDVRRTLNAPAIRTVSRTDPFASGASAGIVVLAGLIGAMGLVQLVVNRRAARITLRDSTTVEDIPAARERRIEVRASENLAVPIALMGRRIRIPPSSLCDLENDQLDAVMFHEIAHVERRDPEWVDFARLISAITRWQPLNRRMLESWSGIPNWPLMQKPSSLVRVPNHSLRHSPTSLPAWISRSSPVRNCSRRLATGSSCEANSWRRGTEAIGSSLVDPCATHHNGMRRPPRTARSVGSGGAESCRPSTELAGNDTAGSRAIGD